MNSLWKKTYRHAELVRPAGGLDSASHYQDLFT